MAARIGSLGYPAVLRFEHLPVSAPWPRGPFDVMSVVDVMHHVPLDQRRALIGLVYSSLRPAACCFTRISATGPTGGLSPIISTTWS